MVYEAREVSIDVTLYKYNQLELVIYLYSGGPEHVPAAAEARRGGDGAGLPRCGAGPEVRPASVNTGE